MQRFVISWVFSVERDNTVWPCVRLNSLHRLLRASAVTQNKTQTGVRPPLVFASMDAVVDAEAPLQMKPRLVC